ncbi:MAG: hypothetical protein ABII64_00550 [Elusimicrobiota bacterium]
MKQNKILKSGTIVYNTNWKLDYKKKTALLRMAELGVNIYSSIGEDDYTLLVPYGLVATDYIEIGYLISQLVDTEFPDGYGLITDIKSEVIKKQDVDLVEFVDSHPHGLKYRVIYANNKDIKK